MASEKKSIPETYKAILESMTVLPSFDENEAKQLSKFSKMRNLLAHEYLDIRFSMLKKFVEDSETTYKYLIDYSKGVLNNG